MGGWRKNFNHIVFCFSDNFERFGGTQKEGRIGVFLSQLSTLSLALPACFPGMSNDRMHIASPIIKPDLTPQLWALHALSRQWLLEEEIVRYAGRVLQPSVCSGELASVGYDESKHADNFLPATEAVFTAMPNAALLDLPKKMGVYELRDPTPRPSPIQGMFEKSRSLSSAGAKKCQAISTTTASNMSSPSSIVTAQMGPVRGGGMQQPQSAPQVLAQNYDDQANDMDITATEDHNGGD